MPLINLRRVSLAYGSAPLLDAIDLSIEAGERLCLVGRNGTGKSSLLKVIAGAVTPDSGEIARQQGLRCAELPQEVPAGLSGSVYGVVARGLGEVGTLLAEAQQLQQALAAAPNDTLQIRHAELHHALDEANGWHHAPQVSRLLDRMGLSPDATFEQLSGGNQRRVLLARALVAAPDLLLLDEPTNHLDIEAITWLEETLLGFTGSVLFITHDRQLIRRLATRIIELDRGVLTSFPGDYAAYLSRKAAQLDAEATNSALFDKKLAQEEAWIRQGIKARRTRNEGRVRALQALREEYRARRERAGQVKLSLAEAERSGRLVLEAEGVDYRIDGRPIIRDFSTVILRGDKIGIIGPNGCGKTTLLRLLLGELQPDRGHIRHGTQLQIAYFDQFRAALDPEKSVQDNVAGGRTQLDINGSSRHVISYLQDFLFSPARAHSPVKALSGGERNRLLLARLFLQPANLLVLDEPTNDLDVETLELLEERLTEYTGTLLLVSHDRAFLDNVVTRSLVFEGEAQVNGYVGGYSDWLRQRPAPTATGTDKPIPVTAPSVPSTTPPTRPRKLSYKEQRELEGLPAQIETLEAEQARLHAALADGELYKQGGTQVAETQQRLNDLEQQLTAAYARWEALEALR